MTSETGPMTSFERDVSAALFAAAFYNEWRERMKETGSAAKVEQQITADAAVEIAKAGVRKLREWMKENAK